MREQHRTSIQIKKEFLKMQEEKRRKLYGSKASEDKTKKEGKKDGRQTEMSEVDFLKWLHGKEIEEQVQELTGGVNNM